MERVFIQTHEFSSVFDQLEANRMLIMKDYQELEDALLKNPELGTLIKGTGGLRKTRLKSSSKGKRGGFRVCYVDIPEKKRIYMVAIFGKNEKENLTQAEKNSLRKYIELLRREK